MASILWPMLAQIGLTFFLYAWLTYARWRAVEDGLADYSAFEFGRGEPPHVARITRNLANQFELPVIFYAMIVLLIVIDDVRLTDVIAAWIFFFGRLAHALVQTLTDNVVLRGRVFMINFLAVCVLVAHVAWLAWRGLGG